MAQAGSLSAALIRPMSRDRSVQTDPPTDCEFPPATLSKHSMRQIQASLSGVNCQGIMQHVGAQLYVEGEAGESGKERQTQQPRASYKLRLIAYYRCKSPKPYPYWQQAEIALRKKQCLGIHASCSENMEIPFTALALQSDLYTD